MTDLSLLPDPERARKNIESFLSAHPDLKAEVGGNLDHIATLFCNSQFLANYCTQYPDALFSALRNIHADFDTGALRSELNESLKSCASMDDGMKVIRRFRKDKQIIITIKDLAQISDLSSIVLDMSCLADAILCESLNFVAAFLEQRYGTLENNAFALIGLGKLGAQELNYSSDVDIVFVYRDDGETSGVSSIPGVTMNRITALEYYVKLVEALSRFISVNTGDGFAYRVDLRLRPEGQRGSLALPLKGYEDYYESWGRLWEKAALLRARPVAGDETLGRDFLSVIRPFIYRKYMDIETIDEIKRMKSQVEQLKSGTFSRDIKRGYGGIREIEFFIQVFQLIYGGKEPSLRERSTVKALHRLVQKGLIGYDDMRRLSENYVFLRTLEHRMQQLNDLQTQILPTGEKELEILGKKMGFAGKKEFLSELEVRRKKVRSIYDSLFQDRGRTTQPPSVVIKESILSRIFWDVETPIKQSLEEELSKRGVRDIEKAIHYLMQIRNNIYSFQTIRGRRLLEEIVPQLVEAAVSGDNLDAALLQLVGFSRLLATSESYLDPIAKRPEMIAAYAFVFSHSEYLSKILMSNPEYMETLVERALKRKPLSAAKRELELLAERSGETAAIRMFKKSEEIRLGMLFLNGEIDILRLMKGLSKAAEAVLSTLIARHSMGLTIAAFGKLGGREIIFNSDLDIVFVTLNDTSTKDIKDAENLLKVLMSYTKDGVAYKVDTRLRPDGSKGPLVVSFRGIADYYLKNAHPWELQALLRARPVGGHFRNARWFIEMKKEVLMKRACEITISDIRQMRERIRRELSKEDIAAGIYDVKLGPGGLEELEFAVQYLQLKNCNMIPALIVQGTLNAVRRLEEAGILSPIDGAALRETYIFFRTIETVLRLRNETVLKEGSDTVLSAAKLLGLTGEGLMNLFDLKRRWVSAFMEMMGD